MRSTVSVLELGEYLKRGDGSMSDISVIAEWCIVTDHEVDRKN